MTSKQFLGTDISIPGGLIDATNVLSVEALDGTSDESRSEFQRWDFECEFVDALGHLNLEGKLSVHRAVNSLDTVFELPLPQPQNHEFLGAYTGTSTERLGGHFSVSFADGYPIGADTLLIQNNSTSAISTLTGRRVRFSGHGKVYLLQDDYTLDANETKGLKIYPTLRVATPDNTVMYLEPEIRVKWGSSTQSYVKIIRGGAVRFAAYFREAWKD